jgi:RpiB/LacA/LacB family sugar-phosphate isomerase
MAMNHKIVIGGETIHEDIVDMIIEWVHESDGFHFIHSDEPYDIASVCNLIKGSIADLGILISDLGVDAAILANREGEHIRAVACFDTYTAMQAVNIYDANVLCLGIDSLGPGNARCILEAFLTAHRKK